MATHAGKGVLIQAKSSSNNNKKLNWDAVKDVVTGEAFYQRKYQNVTFQKICITNQYFNAQAHEQAALNDVLLIEQDELAKLLLQHPVTMLEIEASIYSEW